MLTMQASLMLLLMASEMIGVRSEAVHILGQNYEMVIPKTYYGDAPSFIEFTTVNASIVVYINGKGYDLGARFGYDSMVQVPGYTPNKNYNFVNRFGNVVMCKEEIKDCSHRLYFNISNRILGLSTGDSPYNVQCRGDFNGNRVFIINDKKRSLLAGKLYAFNTAYFQIIHFWVPAQEIVELSNRITAVAVSQQNGDILLSEEVKISGKKAFNMILLKPLEGLSKFKSSVTEAEESIFEILEINTDNRINSLKDEVSRLRNYVEQEKLYGSVYDLPEAGLAVDGSYEVPLKEAIVNLGTEMVQFYTKNVDRNKPDKQMSEELFCKKSLFVLTFKASKYLEDFQNLWNISLQSDNTFLESEVKISKEKCEDVSETPSETYLCGSTKRFNDIEKKYQEYDKAVRYSINFLMIASENRDDVLIMLGIETLTVNIHDQIYNMNLEKTYFTNSPTSMDYMNNISSLVVFIKDQGYTTGHNFAPIREAKWYKPEAKDSFIDMYGNEVTCENGLASISIQRMKATYAVPRTTLTFIFQCVGDYKRSRVFFLNSDTFHPIGKLYVISTKEIMDTLDIKVREIQEVGNSITALALRSPSGYIYLSEEVTVFGRNAFNIIVLKPASDEEKINLKNISITDIPLPNNTYDLDGNEFLYAVREGEYKILDFYERNWKSRTVYIVKEYLKLRELARKSGSVPSPDIRSPFNTGNSSAIRDSFNIPMKENVRYILDELVHKYVKNMLALSDDTLKQIRKERTCPTILNYFQSKMLYYIQNTLDTFPIEEKSSLIEPGLEWFSKAKCMLPAQDKVSCARWDTLREIKTRHEKDEQFLKEISEVLKDMTS